MARARKRRKSKESHSSVPFFRYVIIGIFCLFIVMVIVSTAINFVKDSSYFVVNKVYVDPSLAMIRDYQFSSFVGKSMFTVDLKKMHSVLVNRYPGVAQLKIIKRYPDTIMILAKKREPCMQVLTLGKYFDVDIEGVVVTAEAPKNKSIPTIVGGIATGRAPQAGSSLSGRDIHTAISIIQEFKSNSDLSRYSISKIDIANLSKIVLTMSNDLEIIVDRTDVSRQVKILAVVLTQQQVALNDIRYIDLRFKEPVIGKKG